MGTPFELVCLIIPLTWLLRYRFQRNGEKVEAFKGAPVFSWRLPKKPPPSGMFILTHYVLLFCPSILAATATNLLYRTSWSSHPYPYIDKIFFTVIQSITFIIPAGLLVLYCVILIRQRCIYRPNNNGDIQRTAHGQKAQRRQEEQRIQEQQREQVAQRREEEQRSANIQQAAEGSRARPTERASRVPIQPSNTSRRSSFSTSRLSSPPTYTSRPNSPPARQNFDGGSLNSPGSDTDAPPPYEVVDPDPVNERTRRPGRIPRNTNANRTRRTGRGNQRYYGANIRGVHNGFQGNNTGNVNFGRMEDADFVQVNNPNMRRGDIPRGTRGSGGRNHQQHPPGFEWVDDVIADAHNHQHHPPGFEWVQDVFPYPFEAFHAYMDSPSFADPSHQNMRGGRNHRGTPRTGARNDHDWESEDDGETYQNTSSGNAQQIFGDVYNTYHNGVLQDVR